MTGHVSSFGQNGGVEHPPTSVVICSRNRPQMLRDVVASVLDGHQVPAELVIVDQSDLPNDQLKGLGSQGGCEVNYRWSRSVGLSLANNDGAAAARHDLLLFTHDDVLVAPDWFSKLVSTQIQQGRLVVTTGRVLADTAEAQGAFAPSTKADTEPAVFSGRRCDGVLYPQNMAMDRAVFSEIGGFDERLGPGTPFPAAEDNDFCWRLLEAGYRIVYEPQATVRHRAWRSQTAYLPLRWGYGRGQGAFYAKYLSANDRFLFWCMVSSLRGHIGRFARRLGNERRLDAGEIAYTLGVLTGAAQWLLMPPRRR